MSGVAEHLVPAFVPLLPPADPVWEATRANREPVRYRVTGWLPAVDGCEAREESVACYTEAEAAAAWRKMQSTHVDVLVKPAVQS